MDARLKCAAVAVVVLLSMGANYRTQNFIISAPTSELAQEIGRSAERFRRDLAVEWIGEEMPPWAKPCMLSAQVSPNLGAGGATSFVFNNGEVFGWEMNIQGSRERILDSVLPHEITHTIFACHFREALPRWADEGACTTVEHISERSKQDRMLITFLKTGRGISFSKMFLMEEYPRDVMPLYSQGYSLTRFLLEQGGKQKFLQFLATGMESKDWPAAILEHYRFPSMLVLQNTWLQWVRMGSPPVSQVSQLIAKATGTTPGSSSSDLAFASLSENRGNQATAKTDPQVDSIYASAAQAERSAGANPPGTPSASTRPTRINPPAEQQAISGSYVPVTIVPRTLPPANLAQGNGGQSNRGGWRSYGTTGSSPAANGMPDSPLLVGGTPQAAPPTSAATAAEGNNVPRGTARLQGPQRIGQIILEYDARNPERTAPPAAEQNVAAPNRPSPARQPGSTGSIYSDASRGRLLR